ncbi:MAG: amidohydrolase [Oscillospiraceae bacterium]|nr:amidohydrolase [Oscillospiraceae bacterium]
MDYLFRDVVAVLMDRDHSVLRGAYVGVEAGRIAYVGNTPPGTDAASGVARAIDGRGCVLMPGLINAHTHLPMTLLRGHADDAPLASWLSDHIWPAEARLDSRAVRAGTMLALAELLASGTVSVSDMYYFCDDIAACVAQSGLKANLSRALMCPDGAFDAAHDERLREAVKLYADWHGFDDGRIVVEASIHAEYTSPPALWEAAARLALDNGMGMHVHVSETHREHEECLSRWGLTPTEVLDRHGAFGARTTVAHGVWLTGGDMDILAARGASVAHCPVSNLKLACGVARVSDMMSRGVNVALGTDSAASNNSLDLWEEVKTAALLAKNENGAPELFTAPDALSLAVTHGAQAQGRAKETGQIAVGFDADLILLDFDKPHLSPCRDPLSHLAYATRGSDVAMTMVRGKILYENGSFPTIDVEKAKWEAEHYALPLIFATQ